MISRWLRQPANECKITAEIHVLNTVFSGAQGFT
jgi:hypothetical protein